MPEVRLGRVFLGWCDHCGLPLLDKECSVCGSHARNIPITPPGDYRLAFPGERERLEEIIEDGFGVRPVLGYPLVVNKIPDIDMAREVIWRGCVIGIHKFDIFRKKEIFLPRICFAQTLIDLGTDRYVVADDGAVDSIKKSSNLLCPGVINKGTFEIGDEVIIVDRERKAIATGSAKVSSSDMPDRGVAIKVRQRERADTLAGLGYDSFDECVSKTIEANRNRIESSVAKAKRFIKEVIRERRLPVACSLSGGKDSTATLLLLLDAGIKPRLLFTDTGLEFEETVDTVHTTAEKYGLELLERKARTDFFDDLEIFGNSSRDYRWCCKTRKMAPMAYLINENFPDGVLTFIGQRRYESQNREKHGAVWTNPWLKKQMSASPIQNWNAMEVWLYLFSRGVEYNPLYGLGFERIGCWLCPASDLYDFELYKHRDYARYMEYLCNRYDEDSIALGLWRFRRAPRWYEGEIPRRAKRDTILVDEGLCIRFYAPADRVKNMALALGPGVEVDGSEIRLDDITKREDTRKVIYKARYCAGCGLCESSCDNGAIYIEENKAWIDEERCTSCGACLDYLCPAVEYMD
jgi:phosphoadenosine phosphosulfate reductase